MPELLMTILIGVVGGFAVGLQSPISGAMSQRVGGIASSFIIHVSGAFLSGALLLFRGGEQIQNWRTLSWYMLGAGMFGVILYLTLSHTLPRLGATAAVVLIIIGQLAVGMVVDHFGLLGVAIRSIDGWRVMGTVLLIVAAYMIVR
ncbi:MAG: DMT family transporter [Chloroflexi bacterium]|nr:DMT family transporter [Chloroflexota bacterium]